MQIVRAILPQVNAYSHTRRPSKCPRCGCGILHKHGEVSKRVKDIYVEEIANSRNLCIGCGRAFTHYPAGVDRNGCARRIKDVDVADVGAWTVAQVDGMRIDDTGMPGV